MPRPALLLAALLLLVPTAIWMSSPAFSDGQSDAFSDIDTEFDAVADETRGRSGSGSGWRAQPLPFPATLTREQPLRRDVGALSVYALSAETVVQWWLPGKLNEVSGVAVVDDRIYVHTDEKGIIYRFDPESGEIAAKLKIGGKAERGDFEGIAHLGDAFYLVTSDGFLYRAAVAPDVADGDAPRIVGVQVLDLGLAQVCEIEGLAAVAGALLIACKEVWDRNGALLPEFTVWKWTEGDAILSLYCAVPHSAAQIHTGKERFNPSGIAVLGDQLILPSARQRHLLMLDRTPERGECAVIGARKLKKKRHPQAEGIGFLSDGALVLADEGGDGKALMSLYQRGP
jgi:hypothetical protein